MANSNINSNERNSMIIRFILIYIISILCAIIPLYSLFNLSENGHKHLSLSADNSTPDDKMIEQLENYCSELDSLRGANSFGKEYKHEVEKFYSYIEDEVADENPYKTILKKTADLFEILPEVSKSDIQEKYDECKEKNKELEDEKDEFIKEIADLKARLEKQ